MFPNELTLFDSLLGLFEDCPNGDYTVHYTWPVS